MQRKYARIQTQPGFISLTELKIAITRRINRRNFAVAFSSLSAVRRGVSKVVSKDSPSKAARFWLAEMWQPKSRFSPNREVLLLARPTCGTKASIWRCWAQDTQSMVVWSEKKCTVVYILAGHTHLDSHHHFRFDTIHWGSTTSLQGVRTHEAVYLILW